MNDIVKVCRTHGELFAKDVVGKENRCRRCRKIIAGNNYLKNYAVYAETRERRRQNKEKWKEEKRKSFLKNKHKYLPKLNAYKKEWREKNPDKYKLSVSKSTRRKVNQLKDCYIKDQLVKGTSLSYKDIPQEMVDLKRSLILIKRYKKEGERVKD